MKDPKLFPSPPPDLFSSCSIDSPPIAPFSHSPPAQIPHLLVFPPHYHRYFSVLTCGNDFGQGTSSQYKKFYLDFLCIMLYLSNSTKIYDTNNETAMMFTPAAQDFDKRKISFWCVNPWIDRAPSDQMGPHLTSKSNGVGDWKPD